MPHARYTCGCNLTAFKQPYLTRESERQLLMYLRDKGVIISDFHLANRLQRVAEFSYYYIIDYIRDYLIDYNVITS